MSGLVNSRLVGLLACQQCGGDLRVSAEQLQCSDCDKSYEIRDGIPCLYPSTIDEGHLREEQSLFDLMLVPPGARKEQFIQAQWNESKEEFWGMVKASVEGNNKAFINIGCGYDTRFVDYEKEGNLFVNFDLIFDLLYMLKSRYGAESCVAGDINVLPFKKESFDYAISIDVIHHESDDLESLIRSFADLLKPGGTLFLEDLNAWGIFQVPKSILLPRQMYRLMRKMYHRIRRTAHQPADYEFPTSVWKIQNILRRTGFSDIVVHPNNSYPCIGPGLFRFYRLISRAEHIRKYHSCHYMISARKGAAG
jgi:SAM-dependent methyltransferase